MSRIKVSLSLAVVAPLLDVIKSLADDIRSQPAVGAAALPQGDAELEASWVDALLESQRSDLAQMLALFGEEFFSEGVVYFDSQNGEAIIRTCSAVRLRLRERHLAGLGDEALEAGEVDLNALAEPMRKAFMCYLFLATIQELIIQHLDETIIES